MSDTSPPDRDSGAPITTSGLPVLDPKTAPMVQMALRPKSTRWDRSRIFIAIVALFWLLLWTDLSNNPIESFSTVFHLQLSSLWWVEALIGFEILRQVHYRICERSPRWNRAWTQGVFALPR